jgi:hypothetical protein
MKTSIQIFALASMILLGQFSTLMAGNHGQNKGELLRKEVVSQVAFPKSVTSGSEQKVNVSFTVDEKGVLTLVQIDAPNEQLKNHIRKELSGIKLHSNNYLVGVEYKMTFNFIAE